MYRQSEKQQYLLHMSSQYAERLRSVGEFGHPSKFQPVSRVGFVTAPTSLNEGQPNLAVCSAVSLAGTLYICLPYFYTWCGPSANLECILYMHSVILPPNGILPCAKFTLRASLAFSYIGSFTAGHSSSGRQPNFAAWYLHTTGRPSR